MGWEGNNKKKEQNIKGKEKKEKTLVRTCTYKRTSLLDSDIKKKIDPTNQYMNERTGEHTK